MRIALGYRPNLIELSTPVLLMLYGSWFILFDPFAVSQYFVHLNVLPHYIWGLIFLTVSAAKFYSVCWDNYRVRRAAAIFSILLWLILMTVFADGNPRSLMIPTCFYFAYQSFLSWHKIRQK